MVVEKGFKQTDIGVIPEDWDVITLKDHVEIKSGESPTKFEMLSEGVPYYKVEQLNNHNKYAKYTPYKINSIHVILKGSIIFPKRGASIFQNKIRLLSEDSYMDTNLMTLTTKESIYNEYLYYQLLFKGLDKVADTTSIPQINNKHITPFNVPLPPLPEQTAIANALSDMDALIAQTEKLIEKKKAIKQGVMQELLKPKEGWVTKKLGEVCEIIMGQSPLSEYYNFTGIGLPLIQGNADIKNRKTITRTYSSNITKKGKLGDIIMTVRAPVGEIAISSFECCLGRGVCALRYENDFMYHYLISMENYWSRLSSGSTFDSVNSSQIRDLPITLPGTKKEQIEIAKTLTDLDKDIELTETKLQKLKNQKQGMMQALLTGKIRLI